jgi:ubiquinone/menaquinone biosynthesis C-methylase UbiE
MATQTQSPRRFAASPDPVGDDRAYLDFVLGLRTYWARGMYPSLKSDYDAQVARASKGTPRSAEEAAPLVELLPRYPFFGWIERGSQKMMWRRLEQVVEAQADDLRAALNAPIPDPIGRLELDPNLELPDYYTQTEFHIQPGGVWSGDENAFVYELGAKIVMLGENDEYLFHQLFVETAIPRREYRVILDLACGFGKSTRPLADAFPDAEVVGIDLSAPNLKLAHQQAEQRGKRITFSQRNAEATGYPDGSFDLVTATMFIHEIPMPSVRRAIVEAHRLLRPGGVLAFLDFAKTGDAFRDFMMVGHGARNNEPYMPHLFRTDVVGLCREAGFRNAELLPFDERGAGLLTDGRWPERAEWHFPWVVVRAER